MTQDATISITALAEEIARLKNELLDSALCTARIKYQVWCEIEQELGKHGLVSTSLLQWVIDQKDKYEDPT